MSGNMYKWVGFTWNPIAGKCPHECEYCYVPKVALRYANLREKYSGPIRLDKKAFRVRFPKGKTVFVCSMNDMFASEIPSDLILTILEYTHRHKESEFLFQTKNPRRLASYIEYYPQKSIFGTTIETNRDIIKTRAPSPRQRYEDFLKFISSAREMNTTWRYMISIEPIIDFDIDTLVGWVREISPDFVSIGADSKNNNLPEPDESKIEELISELEKFTTVYLKHNLRRLVKWIG